MKQALSEVREICVKTLFVMRHAKSDWTATGGGDFDRPLNDRGRGDLPRVAHMLGAFTGFPDVIIASPAARARQTAEGIAPAPETIHFEEELYLAGPATLTTVLARAGGGESALVIAHNPGVEEWLEELCGARLRMATAAIACLHLDLDKWRNVGPGCGQLQWFVIPRLLKAVQSA